MVGKRTRADIAAALAVSISTSAPAAAQPAMTATDVLGTVFTLYASAELCSIDVTPTQLAEMQRIGARMQVLSGFPYAGIDPMIEQVKKQLDPAACERLRARFAIGIADAQANAAKVEARQAKPD